LRVEYLQRARVVGVAHSVAEQRVALPDHSFVIGSNARVARCGCDQQVVEVVAPAGRAALHEFEIVRREHRHPEEARAVLDARHGLTIDPDAVPTCGSDLGFEQLRPLVVDGFRAHDGRVGAVADERGFGNTAERRAGRGPAHCFEQARLALRVRSVDDGHAWWKTQLRVSETAEVGQPETGEVHRVDVPLRRCAPA
jgi:hypothetical protein